MTKIGRREIHKHPKVNSNGFQKNPQNINRNGRPVNRPLKQMLEELSGNDFTITVPMSACEIVTNDRGEQMIRMKLPSKEAIALSLQKNAGKDVRWFQEWAKVCGEYAAVKTETTGNIVVDFTGG